MSREPTLTPNARTVLERRYLARAHDGKIVETPGDMFRRVARAVASSDSAYGEDVDTSEERFFRRMERLEFLPNSPTLMNAGRSLGQLAACFVVPVGDSIEEIFDAVKWAAEIQMTGGGTGFAFSRLRQRGDLVSTTGGRASGPVSFMDVFNAATDSIKQGGTRRGANMAVLRVDHPDILDFIAAKLDPRRLTNFNISVAVTDAFMQAVEGGATYALRNPRTGEEVRRLEARRVFQLLASVAWRTGDPGVIFIDAINAAQPTPHVGAIESTNPCVSGDTLVLVQDRGWIPIRDLVGTRPRVATWSQGEATFKTAARVVQTGVKPVYRLRTLEGFELRLTGDHLVTTESGDAPAAELERGDRVRLLQLPAPEVRSDSREARLGEIIGWLTGDGHFTNHGRNKPTAWLNFYGADKLRAAPRLLESVRELLGDPGLRLNGVESRDLAYIRSQRLLRTLAERGIREDCKEVVPAAIRGGTPDLVAGYLRALFSADGSVQGSISRGASVRLAASQLELLRGVQLLLLRLGVRSTLYRNRRRESARLMPDGRGSLREYVCAAQHELAVSRGSLASFARAIGFLIETKTDRLAALLSAYQRGPYQDRAFVTVEEVELLGEAEVFDLTEPTSSHFFANGLLVHNCGEQPLLPFESCVLGSVNLARFVDGGELDWERLGGAVDDSVHFLDNVIDANRYPLRQIETITKANRKIGLGVMGFADMLIGLGVPYDAPEALEIGERVARFFEERSLEASAELARRRGPFPNFIGSRWAEGAGPAIRNATTTTVAPTGTISIIAGCSSGIEPLYAVSYVRRVLDGDELVEVHPMFRQAAEERDFWSEELARELAERGSVRGLEAVPEDLQRLYPTAHDISPEVHVRMQAAFQRYSHAAVSKTVNFPASASPEDIAKVYALAHRLGCKGVTVYRDRSRAEQVLAFGKPEPARLQAPADGHCPECSAALFGDRSCTVCRSCGWSRCKI